MLVGKQASIFFKNFLYIFYFDLAMYTRKYGRLAICKWAKVSTIPSAAAFGSGFHEVPKHRRHGIGREGREWGEVGGELEFSTCDTTIL